MWWLKIAGSVIGSVIGSLIGNIFGWLREQRALEAANKQGRTEQANADLTKAAEAIKEAKDVANTVNAADDAELERLRNKWTR